MTATLTLRAPAAGVTVGDPVRVTAELTAPARSVVHWSVPASGENVVRLSATPWLANRLPGGEWRLRRTETWASYSPESTAVLHYEYRIESSTRLVHLASIDAPPIRTISVVGKEPKSAQPSPFAAPRTRAYFPPAAALGAVVAIALLVWLFLRAGPLRRRAEPARTPDEIFDHELKLLEGQLAHEEPGEAFFDWLAEITRWYLEQKLQLPAGKLTSAEISSELSRDGRGLPASEVAFVLAACDGYRFARLEERKADAAESIRKARGAGERIRHVLAPMPAEKTA